MLVIVIIAAGGLVFAWYVGVFDPLRLWALQAQQGFSRDFTGLIREMRGLAETGELYGTGAGWALVVSLMGLGFVYGIFHAVGPGHGKAVITAYAMTQDIPPKRTAMLAFGAALVQGFSAILVVVVLSLVVEGSLRRVTKDADRILEMVSYGAVGLVGFYICVIGLRGLWSTYKRSHAHLKDHDHSHDHHDHHHDHGHDHHDHHDHATCSHNHGPSPEQVKAADTPWKAVLVALSVGIRPCSGAILVLVLTFAFGIWAAGVATVLVMAAGTGITVASMALAALGIRLPLVKALEGVGLKAGPVLGSLGLLGGGLIASIGASLLWDALNRPVHPFL